MSGTPPTRLSSVCTRETLTSGCRSVNPSGDVLYVCQGTELRKASSPLRWWQASQYLRDVKCGNVTAATVVRGTVIGLFNKAQGLLSRYLPPALLINGGLKYPPIGGRSTRTPRALLNLQAGDFVEIRSREEIVNTLDTFDRNRGLLFDREMVGYCGRRTRVLGRVEADHRRAQPEDGRSQHRLSCPRWSVLSRRVQSVLPARDLFILAGDLAEEGRRASRRRRTCHRPLHSAPSAPRSSSRRRC